MIARLVRSIIPLTVAIVLLFPQIVSAHGISIRGQAVQSNGIITGSVGECSCTAQWYTVGLHSGTVTVVATIKGHSGMAMVSYGVRIGLLRGSTTIGFSQAACLASQRHCHTTARITARIHKTGAYYLKISGLGANGIKYAVHIQGHIYRLR